MNTVNFTQFLCKHASENGEDIQGIFDTLVCEKGKNIFTLCVYYSQIFEDSSDEYYYRIILRYLGKNRAESKHFRIDSGILFHELTSDSKDDTCEQINQYQTTRPGCSGRLSIAYGFDVEVQGNYEVDLYVKRIQDGENYNTCEQLNVKELDLVSIAPFRVILQAT